MGLAEYLAVVTFLQKEAKGYNHSSQINEKKRSRGSLVLVVLHTLESSSLEGYLVSCQISESKVYSIHWSLISKLTQYLEFCLRIFPGACC